MAGRGVAMTTSDDLLIAAADKTLISVLRIWEGGFTVVPMALVTVLIGLNKYQEEKCTRTIVAHET